MTDKKEPRPPGRPKGSLSSRSLRQNRLKRVLDQYFDPLLMEAMEKASKILKADISDKTVSASVQLQAVKLIVDNHLKLTEEVYKREKDQNDSDQDDDREESQAAVLSFVIPENRK
jgi:hypothetical protein